MNFTTLSVIFDNNHFRALGLGSFENGLSETTTTTTTTTKKKKKMHSRPCTELALKRPYVGR